MESINTRAFWSLKAANLPHVLPRALFTSSSLGFHPAPAQASADATNCAITETGVRE